MGNLEALVNSLKRTAAIASISLATLIGTPNKTETPIFAQETKKTELTIQQQTENLYTYLSEQHTEIGNSYKNAKLYTEAKEQYQKALHFTPENKKIKDIITKLPEKNEAKDPAKARKNPDKKYETFKKEAIKKIEETGRQLLSEYETETNEKLKLEKKYKTFEVIDEILEYDKTNELPFTLRPDFEKYDGIWQPKWMKENRELGKKFLSEASEGEVDNKESDIEGILGIKQVYKRTDGKIFIRTTVSEERSKEIFKLTDATIKYVSKKLGIEGWPFNPDLLTEEQKKEIGKEIRYQVTEFGKTGEFEEYLEKIIGRNKDPPIQATTYKWEPWSRTSEQSKNKILPGQTQEFISKQGTNDNLVNYATQNILGLTSESLLRPDLFGFEWLSHGYRQKNTAEMLGTIKTNFYTGENKYVGKENTIVSPDSPEQLRYISYETADQNNSKIDRLLTLKLAQFMVQDFAHSLSLVEFLDQNYKEGLNDFLTDKYRRDKKYEKTTKQEAIKTITKKENEQIQKEWQNWAKYNYPGFYYK